MKTQRLPVALLAIGTAVPPSLSQQDIAARAESFNCSTDEQRAWLRRVFLRSGVDQRGSVLNAGEGLQDALHFYAAPSGPDDHGPSTGARMERYAAEAPALAARAAAAAVTTAALRPADISHLITTSCTGFFAPGLDAALIERLGLSPSVRRLHLGFMGCHAAFNALAAARDAVHADPEALVLVCSIELSTLHFAYGFDPQKLIANALFADGASACIVGNPVCHARKASTPSPARWQILDTASLLIPDSSDAMTWHIGDHGFAMSLSPGLPAIIRKNLRPWIDSFLAQRDLRVNDVEHWAIHPGGPKILAAAQQALDLPDQALHASHSVLARHGNMSSATLMFLLNELSPPESTGLTLAIGFGPGLIAETLLLRRLPAQVL